MDSPYSVHESASLSKRQKLQLVYDWVRKNDRVPDFSGDVTFIRYRKTFDEIICAALEKNSKEKPRPVGPQFVPRPWQEKVLTDLENQSNRTVLWVFDFDGYSGKSELAKYLCDEKNFQQLAMDGSSTQAYRQLNDRAHGYVIDFTRHTPTNKIRMSYKLIGQIKDGMVQVGRLNKFLRSTTIVIFANFLPNMANFSIDRWSFFHTTLGPVYFHCVKVGRFYNCAIAKENKTCDVDVDLNGMINSRKTDSEFLDEYFSLFGDQKAMFAKLVS